jgi:hypothetical protein
MFNVIKSASKLISQQSTFTFQKGIISGRQVRNLTSPKKGSIVESKTEEIPLPKKYFEIIERLQKSTDHTFFEELEKRKLREELKTLFPYNLSHSERKKILKDWMEKE